MEELTSKYEEDIYSIISRQNGSSALNQTENSNKTDNGTHMGSYDDFTFYIYLWHYVTPTLFSIIIGLGTLGNALVIYVIASRPAMQSPTNILVASLALADIAFLAICVPFNAAKFAADTWLFGDTVCKLIHYMMYATVFVTVYTLAAVSALRVLVIVCTSSSARYRTNLNAIIISVIIWAVAFLANIPTYIIFKVKVFDPHYSYCGIEEGAMKSFMGAYFVIGYAVPLLVIGVLYSIIVVHLFKHRPVTINQRRSRERNTRTLRVVVLVVVVFGISWLPSHIQNLMAFFDASAPDGKFYEVLRIVWLCLAYGNSCANPFIYYYGSKEFRRSFQELCRCGKARVSHSGKGLMSEYRTERGETITGCSKVSKGKRFLRSRMESLTLGSRRSTFEKSVLNSTIIDDQKDIQMTMISLKQMGDPISNTC